jgi:hypothetical protein
VDFERRIAAIYQNCREPEEIRIRFEELQRELASEIDEAMLRTRQLLLENFDEEVQEKLRIRSQDSQAVLNKYERLLMDLSRTELRDHARFDTAEEANGFVLHSLPDGLDLATINTSGSREQAVMAGRYELPRRSGDAHLYRLGHPLAEWAIDRAKARDLKAPARLVLDCNAHGKRIFSLEKWRDQSGWLSVTLLSVETLNDQEQHLVVSACTQAGEALPEDDPEKLLRLPAQVEGDAHLEVCAELVADVHSRKSVLLSEINQRNLGYFEQEVQKLDAWADDLKLGLEQEIKAIDGEIKEVRRTAAASPTLEEKLAHQKHQRELETKRSKLRRELFARQDDIEMQRNTLIEQLEEQLEQRVQEQVLFNVEWILR